MLNVKKWNNVIFIRLSVALKILIGPLNWGLGHATRCSRIIDALLHRGHEVHLASDGLAAVVLRRQYPELPFYTLGDLHIHYGKLFWWSMAIQAIPFLKWMIKDHFKLRNLQQSHQFDLIISDSRIACRLDSIPSVILISQTAPILPKTFQWGIRKILQLGLTRFDRIWIPDQIKFDDQLSGDLIDLPSKMKRSYVGFLTRMNSSIDSTSSVIDQVLAIISGPEPSRTSFEQGLLTALNPIDSIIVGGKPNSMDIQGHYRAYSDPEELTRLIQNSTYIICRAGYSTLMDLASYHKKLILVPTPGQPEQTYLARRLVSIKQAVIWDMDHESWPLVKARSDLVEAFHFENDGSLLDQALNEIEQYCKKKSKFRP